MKIWKIMFSDDFLPFPALRTMGKHQQMWTPCKKKRSGQFKSQSMTYSLISSSVCEALSLKMWVQKHKVAETWISCFPCKQSASHHISVLRTIFQFIKSFLKILKSFKKFNFPWYILPLPGLRTMSKHQRIWVPSILKWSGLSNLKWRHAESFHLLCVKSSHWKCEFKNAKVRRPGFCVFRPR